MDRYICFINRVSGETSEKIIKTVCTELEKTEWGAKCVAAFRTKKNKIKAKVCTDEDTKFASVDFVCPNDFVMIKLGKEIGFPRGFCCILNIEKETVYPVTFYPKFGNDSRNDVTFSEEFIGLDKIALTIKVSGSTGKVAFFEDKWALSSKNNSLSSDEIPYVVWNYDIMSEYMTESVLTNLSNEGIKSMGVEFFYMQDQTHGYGYKKSGFVVTCIVKGYDNSGKPIYCSPQELVRISRKVGFHVDDPVVLTNAEEISNTLTIINRKRNILTLTDIKTMFPLNIFEHELYVDGDNIEGFVIRRYKDGNELSPIKYKCWPYQLVTQVLRPGLTGTRKLSPKPSKSLLTANGKLDPTFLNMVDIELDKWVVTDDIYEKRFCKMIVCNAAKKCFACNESPPDKQGYWIELGKHAITEIKNLSGTPFEDLDHLLPMLKTNKNQQRTCICMVGLPGLGKSTQARALSQVIPCATYFNQDDFPSKMKFLQAIKKSCSDIVIVDRGNHTQRHRNDIRKLEKWGKMIIIDFIGQADARHLINLAMERIEIRGYNHQTLYPDKNLFHILETFANQYEHVTEDEKKLVETNIITIDPTQRQTEIFDYITKRLDIEFTPSAEEELFINQSVQPKNIPLLIKLEVTDISSLFQCFDEDYKRKDEYHVTLWYNKGFSKKDAVTKLHALTKACKDRSIYVVPTKIVKDDNAVAMAVELPSFVVSDNKYPHITIQTMNNTPSVYSNTLLAKSYDSVRVVKIQDQKPIQVKLSVRWK